MRVLVIIPAYNAAAYLPSGLSGVLNHCRIGDVVVVDDGSSDGTAQVAARCNAVVLRLPQNAGKGAALKRGYIHAIVNGYDAVITLDADGQHPPALIPRLIDRADSGCHDIVIASRRKQFGRMRRERALSNFMTTALVSVLAGVRIEDSQCGFRFIRTGVLRRLSLTAGGFQAESELLIQAGRMGARIGHVDCEAIPGATSHIGHVRDTLLFIAMCLRYL